MGCRLVLPFAALALFALSGCAPPMAIIDVHTHPELQASGYGSAAELEAQRRAANVTFSVGILHTDDGNLPAQRVERSIYCAGVHESPNLAGIEAGLSRGDYRCIKIYLGYTYKYAHDEVYEPVYALAEKYDVPVVFHTGDTDSTRAMLKYADPLTIDEVAVRHPKVTFVLAHCGNPWIESAAELAYKNPNVYLDGSAFLVGDMNRLPRAQVDRYLVEPLRWILGYIENADKLMFGTDWPLVDIPSYAAAFKRAVPRKDWQKVFHDNAVKVFRLDRVSAPK